MDLENQVVKDIFLITSYTPPNVDSKDIEQIVSNELITLHP